jgi:hypothetical protein
VVPLGAKALFGMAFAAVVAAVVIIAVAPFLDITISYDPLAITLLWFAAAGAFTLGLLVVFADPDRAPWFVPDSSIAQQPPAGARPSLPSPWPLAMALVLGGIALASASNGVAVITAGGLLAVVSIAWFLQQWTEHSAVTRRYAERLRDRFAIPVGLPVAVFGLIAVIAVSLSRVFLALPEAATRWVALSVALVILVGAFVVAASQRIARTALAVLCVFALACVIAAGTVGLLHGEHKFEIPANRPAIHGPLPPGINPGIIAERNAGTATTVAGSTSTTATP